MVLDVRSAAHLEAFLIKQGVPFFLHISNVLGVCRGVRVAISRLTCRSLGLARKRGGGIFEGGVDTPMHTMIKQSHREVFLRCRIFPVKLLLKSDFCKVISL